MPIPARPAILDNPALGIEVSAVPQRSTLVDHRSRYRKYPYTSPEGNEPLDDAHRINHALKRIDDDMQAIGLASLLGMDVFLFLPRRLT